MKKFLIALVITVVLLVGWGAWKLSSVVGSAGKRGDAAVEEFHRRLNEAKIGEIHAAAHERFRSATSMEALTAVCERVLSRLGKFQHASRTGMQLGTNNGQNVLALSYDGAFENGKAEEQFQFDYSGDHPVLLHFEIHSPLLQDIPKQTNVEKEAPQPQ
jgi:hypothetical protein